MQSMDQSAVMDQEMTVKLNEIPKIQEELEQYKIKN